MYSTHGFVLKKIDVGESDAVFVIFTKEFGKIRALAQGIKKESAKLKGHLELCSLVSIGFVLGKWGKRLTQATLVSLGDEMRSDPEKLKIAWYIKETIHRHCLEESKDEPLWNLVVESLGRLNRTEAFGARETDAFIRTFNEQFLVCLGFAGQKDLRILEV